MYIDTKSIFNSNTKMNKIQWVRNTTYPKISFEAATIKIKLTHVDIFFFR